jgi:hypothetical protein
LMSISAPQLWQNILLLPIGLLFCITPHFGHIAALISISALQFKQCLVVLTTATDLDASGNVAESVVSSFVTTFTSTSVDVSGDADVADSMFSSEISISPHKLLSNC